ncbi:MAG TPA: YciI family protein [Candidatus Eremiobacteraceae bacterium]|nr:YciI family protein [Candidatus Eremiobacteraceae bacterium]
MRFLVLIDYTDMGARARTIEAHREYIAAARDRGDVTESGPFTDGEGGVYVLKVADEHAARAFVGEDPYYRDGKLRFTIRSFTSSFDSK